MLITPSIKEHQLDTNQLRNQLGTNQYNIQDPSHLILICLLLTTCSFTLPITFEIRWFLDILDLCLFLISSRVSSKGTTSSLLGSMFLSRILLRLSFVVSKSLGLSLIDSYVKNWLSSISWSYLVSFTTTLENSWMTCEFWLYTL